MKPKDLATSITARLSTLAQKQGAPYQSIATSFLIERLVARFISNKNLEKALVFKGGYVGLRVYHSPRFTIDLDALLLKSDLRMTLEKTRQAAEEDIGDGVWFKFEQEINLKAQGEYGGIRQVYRSGIGLQLKDLKRAQIINFDLGIGDPVTPAPTKQETTELLGSGQISWLVYPIETAIAEKLHALVDRGSDNSRAKDIFDLSQFLGKADRIILKNALTACFKYRQTDLPEDLVSYLSKIDTSLLRRGWSSAVSTVRDAPEFEDAFKLILAELRRIDNEN